MLPTRRLIAVTGAKGSGKGAIAAHLCKEHGFIEYAFADPLKQVVKILFDFSDKQLTELASKEAIDERYGFSPRKVMQIMGSEVADLLKEQLGMKIRIWLVAFVAWFEKQPLDQSIVIADCRFLAEEELLGSLKFDIIRVQRPSLIDTNLVGHQSETEYLQIKVDETIVNDGDLEVLGRKTDDFLSKVLTKAILTKT